MTQISAQLTIPAEQVDLMQQVITAVEQMRATLNHQEILTEEEAAKLLKVSVPTLRNWRKANWLPYFCEGKLIKFEKEALLYAYKKRFGSETHFGLLKHLKNT
ncbi:helix-turn-helix domain-containing protein [Runella zeae]|uniref:helix-turn-helix domain-containing protein n=1 Tax=Runella zeae TaxID=94255 RepID=UPI000413EE3E|nr:helix-turn-helix domain-containing protein [Runella zeae]